MLKKGPLCVFACYLFWGILPVFWKLLGVLNSFYVLSNRVLWSLVLAAAVLAVRSGFGKVRAVLKDRRELGRLAAAGCCICVNWGVFIWASGNGHLLDSSLAYYMNPILAILLGTLVFREKLTRLQWLSVAVTFTGLVIAVIRFRQVPWIALVIGGSFAVYGAIKKGVRSDAVTAYFFETLTVAPLALAVVLWMETHGTGAAGVLQGWQWLLLPMAGVVTTVPLLLFGVGIKTTPMSLSGVLMYINPTMQMLLSVLLYGEEFTTTYAILFGFVWTGLVLYLAPGLLRSRKQTVKEKPPCA